MSEKRKTHGKERKKVTNSFKGKYYSLSTKSFYSSTSRDKQSHTRQSLYEGRDQLSRL